MSMIHAKKLLLTHGYESFGYYLQKYMEETIHTKNHPKLCKLAEILIAFFSDPQH
jgi:ERCC4-related helicase